MVLCAIALVTSCGADAPRLAESGESGPREILPGPATGLRATDSILDLALAVDAAGDLHLAWSAAIAGERGTAPGYRTFYARGERHGSRWSSPFEIDDTLGTPRLLAGDRGLTLVTGLRLLAFRSRDGGNTWETPVALLPAGVRKVAAFDAALAGDDLLVACVVQPPTPYDAGERTADHEQRVVVVRLTPAGVASEIELGRFPPSLLPPARPRLVSSGGRLRLAVGLNLDGGEEVVRERPLLVWFETGTAGRDWSAARRIDLAAVAGELGRIEDVDLVDDRGTTHLLLAGHAVHVLSSTGAGRWSPPRRLNPYETRLSRGELRAPAIAAAAAGGDGLIAWIDHRNRSSDRRPWNPLGGLPWSDDNPMGVDNDVFSLPLAALAESPAPADRLTAPSSLARAVQVAAAGDGFLVAWAGRTGVGRELTSGEAPRLFLTSIPAHSAGSTITP